MIQYISAAITIYKNRVDEIVFFNFSCLCTNLGNSPERNKNLEKNPQSYLDVQKNSHSENFIVIYFATIWSATTVQYSILQVAPYNNHYVNHMHVISSWIQLDTWPHLSLLYLAVYCHNTCSEKWHLVDSTLIPHYLGIAKLKSYQKFWTTNQQGWSIDKYFNMDTFCKYYDN